MLTEEPERNLLVLVEEPSNSDDLPPDGTAAIRKGEIVSLVPQSRLERLAPILDHPEGFGGLLPTHHHLTWLHDAGLLCGDLFQCGTELWVVEGDGADHPDIAGHDVRGVPRAAHPHLEDAERHRLVRERYERERRERLEVRDPLALPVHEQEVRQQPSVLLAELRLGDGL